MEDKILFGDFIDFLKSNGAYDQFLKNYSNDYRDFNLEEYFNNVNRRSLIDSAFSWCSSSEGAEYWRDLDYKFLNFLNNYKIIIRRRKVSILGW